MRDHMNHVMRVATCRVTAEVQGAGAEELVTTLHQKAAVRETLVLALTQERAHPVVSLQTEIC